MGVSVDMKIFFMITGLGVGGAERQVLDLADRLNDLGHTIKICYMTGPVLLRPKSNDIELIGLNLQKAFRVLSVVFLNLSQLYVRLILMLFMPTWCTQTFFLG